LPIAEMCYDRGRPLTSLDHLIDDHRLFTTLAADQILEVTREHLREFLQISDANIRRMNKMPHILDAQEIETSCRRLSSTLAEVLSKPGLTYDDLITAHIRHLNRVYDIHYHTFSPTSLHELVTHFCKRAKGKLLEIKKSGGGECIVVLRSLAF
jgi:hypothetical protein